MQNRSTCSERQIIRWESKVRILPVHQVSEFFFSESLIQLLWNLAELILNGLGFSSQENYGTKNTRPRPPALCLKKKLANSKHECNVLHYSFKMIEHFDVWAHFPGKSQARKSYK